MPLHLVHDGSSGGRFLFCEEGSGPIDDYSIWQDFFDTIQSFPGWLQLLVMMIPPALIITLVQQYIAYRLMRAVIELTGGETLPSSMIDAVYSVHEPVPSPVPPVPPVSQPSSQPLPPLAPTRPESPLQVPWQGNPGLEEHGENPHPLPEHGKAPISDAEKPDRDNLENLEPAPREG